MMEKRNKLWRRRQQWRLFKSRMKFLSANQYVIINSDGTRIQHPRWIDFSTQSWCYKYKTMSTPCSCALCRGESYNRRDYKRNTAILIKEELE